MMPSCLSILFRALRIEWRETKHTLFPTTPIETGLFLFFFLLYGCIGYRMLFHTELIDVPNGGAGSYLGYDNLFHLHTRGGAFDISHPFFGIFHLLKTLLTILLTTLFKEKTSGIICLTLMNLLITGGLVLIYRYLKQIVRISSRRALLLTGFTGCFFTTVVLSFTTESYPFSFFLLVFSLLMLSREYMLTGYIKGRTILFLSFLCGGITITNAAKPTMALFLNKAPFWRKIRTGFKVMLPFVICVAAVMGFYTLKAKLFNPEGPSPIETTGQLGQYFIHDETFGKQALVDFWGNTIISTPLTQQLVGKEVVLRPSEYLHSWNNAVIMFLLFLVAASALLNLKYLCIIIPGTIAGDRIYEWMTQSGEDAPGASRRREVWILVLLVTLICLNMWGLFARQLVVNLAAGVLICLLLRRLLRGDGSATGRLHGSLFGWGFFWLMLGLALEAFEGGIKKDYATFSYFFVTSGLASFVLIAAGIAMRRLNVRFSALVKCGQNPMVAYTAAGFLVMPLLTLLHLAPDLQTFAELCPWMGVVRGVLVTAAVMAVTVFFTNRRLFWRT